MTLVDARSRFFSHFFPQFIVCGFLILSGASTAHADNRAPLGFERLGEIGVEATYVDEEGNAVRSQEGRLIIFRRVSPIHLHDFKAHFISTSEPFLLHWDTPELLNLLASELVDVWEINSLFGPAQLIRASFKVRGGYDKLERGQADVPVPSGVHFTFSEIEGTWRVGDEFLPLSLENAKGTALPRPACAGRIAILKSLVGWPTATPLLHPAEPSSPTPADVPEK